MRTDEYVSLSSSLPSTYSFVREETIRWAILFVFFLIFKSLLINKEGRVREGLQLLCLSLRGWLLMLFLFNVRAIYDEQKKCEGIIRDHS